MKQSQTPITPVEQTVVYIAGHEIIVVRLPDSRIAAVLRMFCELLLLDIRGQIRRVLSHPTIGDCLILANIETAGGIQPAYVIIAEAIPIWLAGIQSNKVVPEARDILKVCQLDAVGAIRASFSALSAEAPKAPPSPKNEAPKPKNETSKAPPPPKNEVPKAPPSPEEETPPPPARYADVTESPWFNVAAGFQAVELAEYAREAQIARLEARMKRIEGRMDRVEERLDAFMPLVDGLLDAPVPLTPEHRIELGVLLRALAHQTGQPIHALEQTLATDFWVEAISQLPEATWTEIAAWFTGRLGW